MSGVFRPLAARRPEAPSAVRLLSSPGRRWPVPDRHRPYGCCRSPARETTASVAPVRPRPERPDNAGPGSCRGAAGSPHAAAVSAAHVVGWTRRSTLGPGNCRSPRGRTPRGTHTRLLTRPLTRRGLLTIGAATTAAVAVGTRAAVWPASIALPGGWRCKHRRRRRPVRLRRLARRRLDPPHRPAHRPGAASSPPAPAHPPSASNSTSTDGSSPPDRPSAPVWWTCAAARSSPPTSSPRHPDLRQRRRPDPACRLVHRVRFRLAPDGRSGVFQRRITDPGFDVPTTAAAFRGRLCLPNARFSTKPTPGTTYSVTAVRA